MRNGMGKNYWIITIGLVLVTIIASNLAFLPGPSWLYCLSQILYIGCEVLGLTSFIAVPIGFIALAIIYWIKEGRTKYVLKAFFLLLVIFPVTCFSSTIWLAQLFRWQSRHYAMSKAEQLISSIEYYKTQEGQYPDNLIQLVPKHIEKIPRPGIIGIRPFEYERKDDSYSLVFMQNYILGFNWEVVVYDANDQHVARSGNTTLYETGREHWKYYILD